MSPGVHGVVQTFEGLEAAVPTSADVHEDRAPSEVPRIVRAREDNKGRKPLVGAVWQVSSFSLFYQSRHRPFLKNSTKTEDRKQLVTGLSQFRKIS